MITVEVEEKRSPKQTRMPRPNAARSRKWSAAETKLFLELLETVGPDFTCMASHQTFAERRSQKELRNKYRKESRLRFEKVEAGLTKFYQGG